MARRVVFCATIIVASLVAGCQRGYELQIPLAMEAASSTSKFSSVLGPLGGVPSGVQVTFIGDRFEIFGKNFSPGGKAFIGMNTDLAFRPNSLMTTDRHLLPETPFVYTDPVTGKETILEVEAKVEWGNAGKITVTIPPGVACSATFTNPILRFWGADGSSMPAVDLVYIVGPQFVAAAPKRGLDIGDFTVTVHGEFFSPWTQVAIRYRDPMTGNVVIRGNTLATDITEFFIDRNTLVIPSMPGVVPNSTLGLAEPLDADILLYENIDEIATSIVAEPALDGDAPCNSLRPEGDVPLNPNGTRNSEFNDKLTFLPTGVTDFPSIASVLPESGPEIGGNTVVIHGDQFDAFSVDISDPNNPGIGIECPPNSGQYQRPLEAILVDRQTIVIKMPECPVEIPMKVNFCIRNKYSMDNKGVVPTTGPNDDCVIFEDVYEYTPIPPIVEPVITSIFPAGPGEQPQGMAHDYGLERLMVVGDWFDGDTTLNGGFEFLLPAETAGDDPVVVQAQRVILHNRNLIEVFTRRLPDEYYPLTEDLLAGIRVRNSVGHADFEEAMVFTAMPDADETPVLTELAVTEGPLEGGNQVMVLGENFDTTTDVLFGSTSATDVRFIAPQVLIAIAPPGAAGTVSVTVVDDGEVGTGEADYLYTMQPSRACPILGHLDPNTGSHAGGYTLLAYGAALTPTTRVEFGENSGNWSQNIFFVNDNLLRVEVPEAFPEQIGATIGVGATDPLNGCNDILRTVDFTYTAAQQAAPQILYVDTTVEVPAQPTDFPALHMTGGDRMLVVGSGFDQTTTFDISKPREEDLVGEEESEVSPTTAVTVLTPNLAVMTAPETPDGLEGTADLQAHNAFGDSNRFTVEYVQPGPPEITDVRNLDDGTQTAPIDAEDRLLIFGQNFFRPVTVLLTGCNLENPGGPLLQVNGKDVTVLEEHIIGVTVPADTFCEGPLGIEVITDFGSATFEENEQPIFQLIGPQPPIVEGVFEQQVFSSGGAEVVFFGRFFTDTTEFSVRSEATQAGTFIPVIDTRVVSTTVALAIMPPLVGAPSPGSPGSVRAEELDTTLRAKISGDWFTVQDNLFTVVTDDAPILLAVHPDHGSIFGGEQVLLFGENFQKATGEVNVTGIRLFDANLNMDIGTYQEALTSELPLGPTDMGLYKVLNDHSILLITNPHATVDPEDQSAAVTVIVESDVGNSQIAGGYIYNNEPAVRTPVLLGITPNETKLNGGTSHLISGGFLTEADRIVLTRTSDSATLTLDVDPNAPPTEGGHFAEVNDSFLVFVMPDLSETFAAGDQLSVHAEKDVDGNVLSSNSLSLSVTFAGPPVITPDLGETSGPAFGGQPVTISGSFFTTNSQVLFGTMPARHVVYVGPTELIAITPALPIDVPDPGVDLTNIDTEDGTVDVAVFTQGGWAVLADAYTFLPVAPTVDPSEPVEVTEDQTIEVTVTGSNFVPGSTTVTASQGTITNLVIVDFHTLTFTYHAPEFDPGTQGPVMVTITVETNQGTATVPLMIEIHLDPFITDTQTTFTGGAGAAPTTGIDPVTNTFVVGTAEGGNLVEGGALSVTPRLGAPVALTEIDAGDDFTQPGQFRVVDTETIEFSVPNVFSSQVPTILDGNRNVGTATLTYVTPQGLTYTGASFTYVPSFLDFEQEAFSLPGVGSLTGHIPSHIEMGDINHDGMVDAAVLGTDSLVCWILYANTFGTADVNGDGVTPDFAGSFNCVDIRATEDTFRVIVGYPEDADKVVRLANLDDDDELELLIPGMSEMGDKPPARILIIDTDDTGVVGQSVYTPGFLPASQVLTLAVGDFDGDDRDDIAYITDAGSAEDRRIATLTSPTTAFDFVEDSAYLPARMDRWYPSKLVAGDFDGDGTDDLMYGCMYRFSNGGWGNVLNSDVWTVDLDGSGNILDQSRLDNIQASPVVEIRAIKLNDNDTDDAIIVVQGVAISDVIPDSSEMAGFAIALDPLTTLTVDSYTPTGIPNSYSALADMNADGITDLALSQPEGRWILWLGDGQGGFTDSGRSWSLITAEPLWTRGGIAAADMNADGMAELFMSDGGSWPVNVVLWINVSR